MSGRPRVLGILVSAALVASTLAVAGLPGGAAASTPDPGALPAAVAPPTATPASTAAPNSIAVLGDSISAGTGAVGNVFDAGSEQPENSWATGWAGGLDSLYQRLLSVNSAAAGRNYNRSSNGKKMSDAASQASGLPTDTQYVVIQMGGNDLCRPSEGEMTAVSTYRSQFVSALNAISARVPNAFVFVASIPDIYNLWYLRGSSFSTSGNATVARLFWDNGLVNIIPCKSLLENPTSNSTGDVARRNRIRQRTIDLNNVLAEECAKVLRCRFDDFATFNFSSNRVWSGTGQAPNSASLKPSNQWVFVDGDISTIDHFHPSFAGHRKLAAEGAKASYDWTDDTAPVVSTSVIQPTGTASSITVRASATDASGIRGLQYRVHPLSGTPTAWTTVLASTTDVTVNRLEPSFVEVRALDRNGNFSAGKMTGAFPLPGAPAAPTFSQTVLNNVEGMLVSWRAPSDEPARVAIGAPTIAFEVTASPGGRTCRTEAVAGDTANIPVQCLVTGLTYGETYSFTVRAVTQGGAGPAATAKVNGATSGLYVGPSGPVGNLAVAPTGSDLVVRWSVPANLGGGTLKGYEVRAKRRDAAGDPTVVPGCGTTVRSVPGQLPVTVYFTGTQCTLPGVVRLADYDVEVRTITELPSVFTTKPTMTSDPTTASGWLPEVPTSVGALTTELDATGGAITVRWPALPESQAAPGATVTVTASPGARSCTVAATETSCRITGLSLLQPYSLSVVVANGVGTASAATTARLVMSADSTPLFTDVSPTSGVQLWGRWLLANGVISGKNGNPLIFGGRDTVSRGVLAAQLWRLAGRPTAPTSCGITDLPVSTPTKPSIVAMAICWMKARGAIPATSTTFRPTALQTRGELANFLWRLAGRPTSTRSCGYGDLPRTGDTGLAACWLRKTGLADAAATFTPGTAINRSAMVKFLYKYEHR